MWVGTRAQLHLRHRGNGTAVALLSRFLLPGVFDVGYLYSIAGWDVYLGELLLLSALFVFFAYMNYKGMSCASGIQLIFSLALAAGVAVLAFGSFSTETARFDNLYPLFAEDRAAMDQCPCRHSPWTISLPRIRYNSSNS